MPPQPEAETATAVRCLVTTLPKEEGAAEIVRTLIREQLVACGTMLRGARSIYVWKDSLEDSEEIVVIFKTTAAAASAATARLAALHPYEVPEILLLTPESVNSMYSRWVEDSVSAA